MMIIGPFPVPFLNGFDSKNTIYVSVEYPEDMIIKNCLFYLSTDNSFEPFEGSHSKAGLRFIDKVTVCKRYNIKV